jgi:hypothetical protein
VAPPPAGSKEKAIVEMVVEVIVVEVIMSVMEVIAIMPIAVGPMVAEPMIVSVTPLFAVIPIAQMLLPSGAVVIDMKIR